MSDARPVINHLFASDIDYDSYIELLKYAELVERDRNRAVARESDATELCKRVTALSESLEKERNQAIAERDQLAEALKNLCKAIIIGEPRDITELLKKSGEAIANVKGQAV